MKNWLANLFSPQESTPPAPALDPEALLSVEREVQMLKMDLEDRERRIRTLQEEIERLRGQQQQVIEETLTARSEALFTDLAGPGSQILTLADLVENQGKPVQPQDILSIAKRMVRALERHGVTFDGKIGEQVAFDPNRHTPLSEATPPQPGRTVTVRFAGAMYKRKIIYKSVVE